MVRVRRAADDPQLAPGSPPGMATTLSPSASPATTGGTYRRQQAGPLQRPRSPPHRRPLDRGAPAAAPAASSGAVDRVVTCRAKSSSVAWASLAPSSRSGQATSDASCRPCRTPSRFDDAPRRTLPRQARLCRGRLPPRWLAAHSNSLETVQARPRGTSADRPPTRGNRFRPGPELSFRDSGRKEGR
jgi:hypothetical protein